MPVWWPFPLAACFFFAAWLTPVARYFAIRFGAIDVPGGERKLHDAPTPLWGGVGMIVGFVLCVLGVLLFSDAITSGTVTVWHMFGFLAGILLLTIVGMIDDARSLSSKYLLLGIVCASLFAVFGGIDVGKMTNPFGGVLILPSILASAVAFVWIVAMTITTKLLDGVEGLASSVSGVAALMIAALALSPMYFQSDVALLALMFGAAILGFILWNWYPAHVFLGESGSTVLGFTIGVLSVIAGSKMATAFLVFGIPAIDVGIVAIRRVLAHKNPFTTADRRHAHLMLRDIGLPAWAVTVIYVVAVSAFGVSTLVLSSWQKLVALAVLSLVSGAVIVFLAWFLAKKSPKKLDGSVPFC